MTLLCGSMTLLLANTRTFDVLLLVFQDPLSVLSLLGAAEL